MINSVSNQTIIGYNTFLEKLKGNLRLNVFGDGESAVYSIFEYGLTEQCPENEVLPCVRTTGDCP